MLQSIFTGLSSLSQHQKAMDVTSHNIANANTDGYSKQRINFSTTPMKDLGTMHIGTGVQTVSIERMHDNLLFSKLKSSYTDFNQFKEEFSQLSQLREDIVGEGLSGNTLSDLTDSFFDSVQELSNNPQSNAIKNEIKIKGDNLIQRGIDLNNIFNQYKLRMQSEKERLINEAEMAIRSIANLTKEINQIEAGNDKTVTKDYANDLRDKRDLLEMQLNKIGEFKSFNDGVDYTYEFKPTGGKLEGLNNSIDYVNKTQNLFSGIFDPLSSKVKDFISSDMENPNDMLEWRYQNNPSGKFNDAFVEVSAYVDSVENMTGSTEAVLNNYKAQQEKLANVNMDEEMVNMVRYQRAYEAAAKIIQTSDEMLQTLLSMKK